MFKLKYESNIKIWTSNVQEDVDDIYVTYIKKLSYLEFLTQFFENGKDANDFNPPPGWETMTR